MKTGMMKMIVASATLFFGLNAASAGAEEIFEKMATETGDFCTDQALGHMRYLFGDEVEVKKVFTDGAGASINYWFETNICEGHMVATFIRGSSCSGAHYGSIPLYMQRLYADGNCQQIMSADSYPDFETTFPFIAIA